MLGLGVTISSPVNGTTVEDDPISVRGIYRVRPRPGDNVVLFARKNFTYYPQAGISWSPNLRDRTEYGIVVARVSEDFGVWLRSYVKVAAETKRLFQKERWIGAEMPTLPPGFEPLASIIITRSARNA